ncbi:hypothetical protein A2872_00210 [Candidatus Gottesmanbacteria bacterium RIFCSPHIGHO2_01_FULL_42_12]|uniref:Phosphoribosyltransferase domain-containing protein n=1 Tax=Candidatus Gottesmanbacteria bacterium RIFCSPHIGHO2_01_FULL_42_12 TaxID=1798377 RepID=A0A1F5YZD6_9BACT|nr:MAG: hypothetical protein A2872_00210 [Candidatus Gottesmanbacteria bacterium RIFCSPHIGHO2_01_FULL_42_12]
MFKQLQDFLFPQEKIDVDNLTLVFPQVCPVCGRASWEGLTHPRCRTKYQLDGLYTIYRYKGQVRRILSQAKFNPFTFSNYEVLMENKIVFPKWCQGALVPIPLHPIKLRLRGFNQAEIIAKILGKKLGLPVVTNILKRKIYTRPQKKLNKKERLENIVQAFTVCKPAPKLNTIILVDDIWTTGATLRVCGKLLKITGVKTVFAVTLAM